jgi:RNA polymerase sigma-70 factor, ECF subfamily
MTAQVTRALPMDLGMKFFKRAAAREQGDDSSGDRRLHARLMARDRGAFAALVGAHHDSLVALALVYVGNRAVAEEVAQETWARMLAALPQFEGRSSLRTWIFRICTNAALTRAERESRSSPFSALQDEDEPEVEAERFQASGTWADPPHGWRADTPEKILQRAEAIACIERTLAALPPAQRAVVLLRDVEGLDAAEACDVLRVSESNQRVLLHRGRAKIRRALEDLLGEGGQRC